DRRGARRSFRAEDLDARRRLGGERVGIAGGSALADARRRRPAPGGRRGGGGLGRHRRGAGLGAGGARRAGGRPGRGGAVGPLRVRYRTNGRWRAGPAGLRPPVGALGPARHFHRPTVGGAGGRAGDLLRAARVLATAAVVAAVRLLHPRHSRGLRGLLPGAVPDAAAGDGGRVLLPRRPRRGGGGLVLLRLAESATRDGPPAGRHTPERPVPVRHPTRPVAAGNEEPAST